MAVLAPSNLTANRPGQPSSLPFTRSSLPSKVGLTGPASLLLPPPWLGRPVPGRLRDVSSRFGKGVGNGGPPFRSFPHIPHFPPPSRPPPRALPVFPSSRLPVFPSSRLPVFPSSRLPVFLSFPSLLPSSPPPLLPSSPPPLLPSSPPRRLWASPTPHFVSLRAFRG